jgi:hypothetical protein
MCTYSAKASDFIVDRFPELKSLIDRKFSNGDKIEGITSIQPWVFEVAYAREASTHKSLVLTYSGEVYHLY